MVSSLVSVENFRMSHQALVEKVFIGMRQAKASIHQEDDGLA
jgi:hypothetical protein